MMIKKSNKSLQNSINDTQLSLVEDVTISNSAYTQARAKLNYTAFEEFAQMARDMFYEDYGYDPLKCCFCGTLMVLMNVKPVNDKFSFENKNEKSGKNKRRRKKNTESFEPSHKPADMRVIYVSGREEKYPRQIASNEVILISDLFTKEESEGMYDKLLAEMNATGLEDKELWKLWHGDTHLIADDKRGWKKGCPVFNSIIDRIKEYFNMDVKATRFNWYKDLEQWKPYHHDAAAVKKDKMKTQNFTVGLSFGAEREASFEHVKTRTTVSTPLPNGSGYTFSRDVNVEWRHGIPQVNDNDERRSEEYNGNIGRISIIAWGKVDMLDKV